ncbi:hypothetical protein DPEC_G00035850 [Dallia pectoralis]|uniref:Uncharacterized protein n=1 Tax=Dallia pectoralis TaxID=75939 RepID=A0ACC2HDI5_DALPE|nr:hypothetical protein DPEC_G00035850 [Dallia pectoralis]
MLRTSVTPRKSTSNQLCPFHNSRLLSEALDAPNRTRTSAPSQTKDLWSTETHQTVSLLANRKTRTLISLAEERLSSVGGKETNGKRERERSKLTEVGPGVFEASMLTEMEQLVVNLAQSLQLLLSLIKAPHSSGTPVEEQAPVGARIHQHSTLAHILKLAGL